MSTLSRGQNDSDSATDHANDNFLSSQLISMSYQSISARLGCTSLLFFSIISLNSLCCAGICVCLWGFSRIEDLLQWEKRCFNALLLVLNGGLGFGIGLLADRIGLLIRGPLLQERSYSFTDVSSIWRLSIQGSTHQG